jgi:chaperonin GroES
VTQNATAQMRRRRSLLVLWDVIGDCAFRAQQAHADLHVWRNRKILAEHLELRMQLPPRCAVRSPGCRPVLEHHCLRKEEFMQFRPLHDRVLVRRIEAEEKSAGGIIIPDTAKEKPSQGEVTAVGPGGRDDSGKLVPMDLRVGDRVLFGKWSGTEVKIDGEELLIMKESDIMGVLDEAAAEKKAA